MSTGGGTDVWAVVELMGHVRYGGRLSEEERFGGRLGRVDVPRAGGFVTVLFGAAAVYRIAVVDEQAARAVAARCGEDPLHAWEMPGLPHRPTPPGGEDDPDEGADGADEHDYDDELRGR